MTNHAVTYAKCSAIILKVMKNSAIVAKLQWLKNECRCNLSFCLVKSCGVDC